MHSDSKHSRIRTNSHHSEVRSRRNDAGAPRGRRTALARRICALGGAPRRENHAKYADKGSKTALWCLFGPPRGNRGRSAKAKMTSIASAGLENKRSDSSRKRGAPVKSPLRTRTAACSKIQPFVFAHPHQSTSHRVAPALFGRCCWRSLTSSRCRRAAAGGRTSSHTSWCAPPRPPAPTRAPSWPASPPAAPPTRLAAQSVDRCLAAHRRRPWAFWPASLQQDLGRGVGRACAPRGRRQRACGRARGRSRGSEGVVLGVRAGALGRVPALPTAMCEAARGCSGGRATSPTAAGRVPAGATPGGRVGRRQTALESFWRRSQ